MAEQKRSCDFGRAMLTGFYGGFTGAACDFALYGHKDHVLEFAEALDSDVDVLDVPLRSEGVAPHPYYAGSLGELRVEITSEDGLLLERTGTSLNMRGARENMKSLARDVRFTAQRTHESPVGNVIIELQGEPYMHECCGTLSVEAYDPT
jgi:hypothetical protein